MSLLSRASKANNGTGFGLNSSMPPAGKSYPSFSSSSESHDSKKWTRFAVVVLYLLSVSLAAIFLATYYMVFWDAEQVYCRFNEEAKRNNSSSAEVTNSTLTEILQGSAESGAIKPGNFNTGADNPANEYYTTTETQDSFNQGKPTRNTNHMT